MKRLLIIGAAVLFGLGIMAWALRAPRTAALPTAPPVVRPPYDPTLTYKNVTFYQGRVRMNPQNGAIEWAQLAGAYLQRCRETGDIADALRAEKAARRSLAIRSTNNVGGFNQLGLSLFTQHQFPQAEALAASLAKRYPDDAQTRLLLAETALERGDYAMAERALSHHTGNDPDPSVQAVQARLLDIDGKPALALQLLQQAQSEADANLDMPRENVAWFHMRFGDQLARMGRADAAERSYREALALFPEDFKTMTGLARLAAGRQDWPGTISWGQKAAEIVPTPEVVALIGDAYAASGHAQEAERQYRLIEAMETLSRAQSIVYDRYRSLFDANHGRHLQESLVLAQREMKVRQDIYAYDTLAWACYKNGLPAQADSAMKMALAHGTQDALLLYHAGTIAEARGDHAQAAADFAHASALDPYFHPSLPAVAQHPYGGF